MDEVGELGVLTGEEVPSLGTKWVRSVCPCDAPGETGIPPEREELVLAVSGLLVESEVLNGLICEVVAAAA